MLTLASPTLRVDLLDPARESERAHQGTRFCWGGYIWQVTDSLAGPLLAGPEWPDPQPLPFNGQGLPESFRHAELGSGRPLILEDRRGWIIGIGDVAPDRSGDLAVTAPCAWTVTRSANTLEFCTSQSGAGYACQLTRRVTLVGRTLISATSLTNTGTRPLPLHWFAHPFFALTDRMLTCTVPPSWGMVHNGGYAMDAARRITFKRRFKNKDDGHFEKLLVGSETPLRAVVSHPHLREVVFSADFTPDLCPIWGNSNTWSIEPYLVTEVAAGTRRAWQLQYEFGPLQG